MSVCAEDVRAIAMTLPRTTEALVRDRVKFRVKSLVYLALSRDETTMGFAFPREERQALVSGNPETFLMPVASDERYNWVRVRLSEIDEEQLRAIVVDAWQMVVPKSVAKARLG